MKQLRKRSRDTSCCDFLSELVFYYHRHLEAAAYDVGGASNYLNLADDIADLICSHWLGCPICRGDRAKWQGASPAKASKSGAQDLRDEVRRWIGTPTFANALEPRPGHCWVARLIVSKGKFIRPAYTEVVTGRLLAEHLRHCPMCDPGILPNLVAATPGLQRACRIGQRIILDGGYPFTIDAAFNGHAETCDQCSASDGVRG